MAPGLAGHLYDYLENDVQIPELIDIKRFA